MPVILPAELYKKWLDPGELRPEQLSPLLVAYPAAEMEAYPVSKMVNSPNNDHPDVVRPLPASMNA
jgi:putative SOS response-associated peptidase YedK